MTERGARSVYRDERTFMVGRSSFNHRDGALTLHLHERGAPLPYAIRGRVELRPRASVPAPFALDAAGNHQWWPLAPIADIHAEFSQPDWCWDGCGYLDSNWGSEPLEQGFDSWNWSRSIERERCEVHYDVRPRGAPPRSLTVCTEPRGVASHTEPADLGSLPRSRWSVARPLRAEQAAGVGRVRTLQDAPFYCRSLIETHGAQGRTLRMHESLSLDRFRRPWVQAMLPFRMPRLP